MKRLSYFATAIVFGLVTISCEPSTRKQAHQEVVEEEREGLETVVGRDIEPTGEVVRVVATEMEFHPNEIRVTAGQTVSVNIANQGDEEHSIEFELPSGEKELPQNVRPGTSGRMEFEAPRQAGTYTFYCPVDDHREKGMEGRLVVVEE